MADWKQEVVTVRGARIELLRAGQGDPILILHGSWGNRAGLEYQEVLARDFEIIMPTHPGFAGSERPPWLDSMADLVYYYLDFMDQLRLERLPVLGFSLGGWLAAELAAIRPDLISRLVLEDAAGQFLADAPIADIFLLTSDELLPLCYYDPKSLSAPSRLWPQEPNEEDSERMVADQIMAQRLAFRPFMHNPKLRYRLGRARMPTLIIWGKYDGVIPPAHAEAYAKTLKNAELQIIDRCGHAPHLERPAEFVSLVREFLLRK